MKVWAIEEKLYGKGSCERQYTGHDPWSGGVFNVMEMIKGVCKKGMSCEQKYTDHDPLPSRDARKTERVMNYVRASRMGGSG